MQPSAGPTGPFYGFFMIARDRPHGRARPLFLRQILKETAALGIG